MADEKQSKNRSPVHPLVDLPSAIDVADKLCEVHGFRYAPINVLLQDLGYSPKSSGGLRTLAALIHFGLVEDTGSGNDRRARLTDLARRILQSRRDGTEDQEAIREAALKPTIYRKLWDEWLGDGNWPSKGTMDWELRHTYAFNPASIDSFVRDFRATMEYADLDKDGSDGNIEADMEPDLDTEPSLFSDHRTPPAEPRWEHRAAAASLDRARGPMTATIEQQAASQVESLTIPLHRGAMAVLTAPWPLSKENFEALERWLSFAKSLAAPSEPSKAETDA